MPNPTAKTREKIGALRSRSVQANRAARRLLAAPRALRRRLGAPHLAAEGHEAAARQPEDLAESGGGGGVGSDAIGMGRGGCWIWTSHGNTILSQLGFSQLGSPFSDPLRKAFFFQVLVG